MKCRRAGKWLLALAAAWSFVTPASAAQWKRAESPHFSVFLSGSELEVRERVQNLERLHAAILLYLGVTEGQGLKRQPFELVIAGGDVVGSVFPHLRGHASGIFTMNPDGAMAFASMAFKPGRLDYTGSVVYHEYAHRVMAQYARIGYPVWYVEGFAEYFGATYMDSDGIEIGAGKIGSIVLDRKPWLDATQLLNPRFRSTGEKGVDYSDFEVFYAQAWLLTHYMLSDSDRTQRFNEYFRRVAAGEDALAAFQPATGIAVDRLNDELRSYRDKMYGVRLKNSMLPSVEVRITPLAQAESEVEFARFIIKAQPEAAIGNAALQTLRDSVSQAGGERAPVSMLLALAYAEIRYGDLDRAMQILARWAQLDSAPFEANRLLGLAWQTEATRSAGADRVNALQQARAFLIAAYKQRRNDAPTLYQLARVLYTQGPSESLSNAAEAASELEPQVSAYAVLAVTVHLEAGKRDKATRALQTLANNPHGGESTERARAALQSLQSNQDASDVLALLNGSKKPNKP